MAKLIVVGIVLCWWLFGEKLLEYKVRNRPAPPGHSTDFGKMSSDFAKGMSKQDVMRKTMRGGYDVFDKKD